MRVLQARALLPLAIAMLLVLGACPNRGGGSSSGQAGGPGGTSGANANYRGPFSLSAHPLSEDSLLHNRRILTTEMNTFAADDLAADPAQSSKLQFRTRGIETVMNIPHKLDGRKRLAMFFPDRRVLVSVVRDESEPARVLVIDTETGMELDVTPSNFAALWDGRNDLPLVAWTGKHGLSIYGSGQRADELLIWQGHNTLSEVQRLPVVLAIGHRLDEDGLQFLAVNAALELLAFDAVSGTMLPDPEGTDLAAAIANAAGTENARPVYFAASRDLAALQTRDGSHWALVSAADDEDYIEVHDAAGVTPEGRRRIPGPGDLLGGSEAQRLRREGAQQPPWVINEGFCLPLNDSHVGIFDLVYQRLVVIGLRTDS